MVIVDLDDDDDAGGVNNISCSSSPSQRLLAAYKQIMTSAKYNEIRNFINNKWKKNVMLMNIWLAKQNVQKLTNINQRMLIILYISYYGRTRFDNCSSVIQFDGRLIL